MAIAKGLISSLLNVASSSGEPFCQPQHLHHGSITACLCLCSNPFSNAGWYVADHK